ncbi:Peroxidase (Fragment), partial [Linum perenne]
QCQFFRNCIFNDTAATINPKFVVGRRETCFANSDDTNLASLDSSPTSFDVSYFKNLACERAAPLRPCDFGCGAHRGRE